jgi:hypothetical protein
MSPPEEATITTDAQSSSSLQRLEPLLWVPPNSNLRLDVDTVNHEHTIEDIEGVESDMGSRRNKNPSLEISRLKAVTTYEQPRSGTAA